MEFDSLPATLPTVCTASRSSCHVKTAQVGLISTVLMFSGGNQSDRSDNEKEEGDSQRAGRLHESYMAQLF